MKWAIGLLGLVCLSSGQQWGLGTCPQKKIDQNFDPQDFFTGRWFVKSIYRSLNVPVPFTCSALSSRVDDGIINILFYSYVPMLNRYVSVRGSSQLNSINGKEGKVTFTYEPLGDIVHLQLDRTWQILARDSNYALIYTCQEFGILLPRRVEAAIIVTRVRGDTSNDAEIREKVFQAGLNYNNFQSEYIGSGCPPGEPAA